MAVCRSTFLWKTLSTYWPTIQANANVICVICLNCLLFITIGKRRHALFIFLSDHEWRAKVLRHLISLFVNLSSSAGDLTTSIHTYFLQRHLLANFHFPYLLFCGEVEAIKSSGGGGMDYDKVKLCVKQTPDI